MKNHPQEKYQNIKTKKFEYFTFIGAHRYKREDGAEFTVIDLRRDYKFISTYHGPPAKHEKWEHNPATGFNIRKSYL